MTRIQIEVPGRVATEVERRADARGVSAGHYVADLVRREVSEDLEDDAGSRGDRKRRQLKGRFRTPGVLSHLAREKPASIEEMQEAIERAAVERFERSTEK